MRLTCIHCGKQFDQKLNQPFVEHDCSCGRHLVFPSARETGVRPSYRAAEKLRFRAFLAAGVVNNHGHNALIFAFLSLLFPPFYIAAVAFAIKSLIAPAGSLARYSGHGKAKAALIIGTLCTAFSIGGVSAYNYTHQNALRHQWQLSAANDLKELRKAQLGYKESTGEFGNLSDLALKTSGIFTICMTSTQQKVAIFRKLPPVTSCPKGAFLDGDDFLALAVANLDNDDDLDIWSIDQDGNIEHLSDDLAK